MSIVGEVSWTDVAQLGVGVVGIGLVFWQLRKLTRATQGDAHAVLYGQYIEVGKLFLSHPELRPFFYATAAGDRPKAKEELDQQQIASMCELITSLMEHASLQRENLPGHSWKQCWLPYTKERLRESKVLREWWNVEKTMYAESFKEVVECILEEIDRDKKNVIPTAAAAAPRSVSSIPVE